jgi:hypothetical protein
MANEEAPAVDMAMSPDEFAELRAAAATLGQQDVVLGRALDLIILHLGHAHGLDPAAEDARLKAEAEAKAEEDAKAAEAAAAAQAPAESAPVEPAQEGADNGS